jgi:predicted NAD-dependent protein-ADP-ribosyltransferase YbiA (DUF1768 family)
MVASIPPPNIVSIIYIASNPSHCPPPVSQAHKFLQSRPVFVEGIRLLRTPGEALRGAGRLKRIQRPDWFEVDVNIMDRVLQLKLDQHPGLLILLRATGDSELIEYIPVDPF